MSAGTRRESAVVCLSDGREAYIKRRLMMLGRISQVDIETQLLPISRASPPLAMAGFARLVCV